MEVRINTPMPLIQCCQLLDFALPWRQHCNGGWGRTSIFPGCVRCIAYPLSAQVVKAHFFKQSGSFFVAVVVVVVVVPGGYDVEINRNVVGQLSENVGNCGNCW